MLETLGNYSGMLESGCWKPEFTQLETMGSPAGITGDRLLLTGILSFQYWKPRISPLEWWTEAAGKLCGVYVLNGLESLVVELAGLLLALGYAAVQLDSCNRVTVPRLMFDCLELVCEFCHYLTVHYSVFGS